MLTFSRKVVLIRSEKYAVSSCLEDITRDVLQEAKRDFMCQLHEIVQLRTQHIAYVICTRYVGKISEAQ